ncbi:MULTISPECIES: hypothetical protein [Streptomyces]|uniref:hypothetical protein n=1 Tax=Streptomyces TaxID=1883 RepID=UPI0007C74937|nr:MULTISPECIES: hypothetical protein [Streptomyces]
MNSFRGGGHELDLRNGATEVLVEVLMLAVTALAREDWHHVFAAELARQDQNLMGRGVVGLDLDELDWGADPERNRAFALAVVDLALTRHRWDELGYDPPYAEGYLRTFRLMVEHARPAPAPPADPAEAMAASCVRHRVLTPPALVPGLRLLRPGLNP